ncbi:YdbH domain-containing protein [Sphingobium phenoxybenzoativorans]|uniref:YdbH domain-containing protein n=1 Tax=Sphingobium phenoxybenzoativorans TaxID=1592790 RepID=A0A975Q460_9SPHN|nr:YdbH domain-containing protein [Sphingobium phenoxybenzoativorans]
MVDEDGDGRDGESEATHRGNRTAWIAGSAGALGLVLLGLWTQRAPIAENFIGRELNALDVRARYDLVSIGLRTHRIENIVLGDPARPDLTAKWVEVDLTLSGLTPGVAAVRAGGVRLRGRVHDGALSLGELDKFRDPKSTAPFSLPNMAVALQDVRMRLDTDAGQLGIHLDGRGNLQDGFAGKLAAVMPNARFGGCGVGGATAYVDVTMREGQPRLSGPVRARALGCSASGIALAAPQADMDVTFGKALDRWTGHASLAGSALRVPGLAASRPSGRVLFDGSAYAARGQFDLASAAFKGAGATAAASRASGSWSYTSAPQGLRARAEGMLTVQNAAYGGDDPAGSLRRLGADMPFGPLGVKFANAVQGIGRENRISTRFALSQRGGTGALILSDSNLASRSGARIALGEGGRFSLSWPKVDWALDGSATMEGGGLPKAALRLSKRPGGGFGGQLFMDPYTAEGGASLALEPVRFTAGGGGVTRFQTEARLDGPLPGGGLRGLTLPIDGSVDGRGNLRVNPACAPVALTSLAYENVSLGRTRMTLCPADGAILAYGPNGLSGGASVRAPLLEGRLGQSPLRLSADLIRVAFARPGFEARNADLRIGPADSPVRITAAQLTGLAAGGGMGGQLSGGAGRIGAVPLAASNFSGRWGFAKGALTVNGGLTLSDTAAPDRFNPLDSRNFRLTMQNGRITAKGTLAEPASGATVLLADIVHDLGPGRGHADLDVPGITFSPTLQPEAITRLALGVVANAAGTVSGKGQVRWNGNAVTSDGVFRTDKMDLAAAFGPVSGLSGEIRFTDLVGLVTAPHQEVRIASVNPGIEATDGIVYYRLEPGQKVHIEGGAWPFSGGDLKLLPTTMDFSADTERYLTFRVIGLDAGAFIQKMELENISATGTFDGIMPLIFNMDGGRIAGGVLVARQDGLPPLIMPEGVLPSIPCDPQRQSGTLSYVGPVSNEQVGVFGKMAFDALKNLQYKCLSILMDGALDGEVVTNVVFNGINRGQPEQKGIASNFLGLPFLFNIRIQAPFRGLMSTAKSFVDPSGLIRNSVGDQYQEQVLKGLAVQPAESDKVPSGEQK